MLIFFFSYWYSWQWAFDFSNNEEFQQQLHGIAYRGINYIDDSSFPILYILGNIVESVKLE
jgi:hypothetical protein